MAVSLGLIGPSLGVFLAAFLYRVAKGTQPSIPQAALIALSLVCLASALVGVFSAFTAFTNQTGSGLDLPADLAILNLFLFLGIRYLAKSPKRLVAA